MRLNGSLLTRRQPSEVLARKWAALQAVVDDEPFTGHWRRCEGCIQSSKWSAYPALRIRSTGVSFLLTFEDLVVEDLDLYP